MKGLQSTSEWLNLSSKPHKKVVRSISDVRNNVWIFDLRDCCFKDVCVHSAGETTYNLDTAGGLRLEVQKYYELIDALR